VKLYEHEGKALLAAGGVAVPAGGLWPGQLGRVGFPAVVKAQLLEGGRGKRGGVRFAATSDELVAAAQALLDGSADLPPAAAVWVEERLDIERELYLAFAVDRSSASGVGLVAVRTGGVDVEDHAERDALRLAVPALADTLPAYIGRVVAEHLGLQHARMAPLLDELWRLFCMHDCLLLEVNPLAVTRDGRLVALDARIETDEAARFRHREWPERFEGTRFEIACRKLGVVAGELDGDVAVVTSGAGLGMATLDLVTRAGGRPACLVDLGGAVFRPEGIVQQIVRLIVELKPRVILVNSFLQVASFESVAVELAAGLGQPDRPRLVVRAAGRHMGGSQALLEAVGGRLYVDVDEACRDAAGVGGQAVAVG
jgi:succinyl-CoA synthetase beta subunit